MTPSSSPPAASSEAPIPIHVDLSVGASTTASNGNGNGNGASAAAAVTPSAAPSSSTSSSSSSSSSASTVPSPFLVPSILPVSTSAAPFLNKPTFLENDKVRFLIMDAPNDQNIQSYVDVLKRKNVVAVARACDPSYSTSILERNNIRVVEVPFQDGDPPPPDVITKWLHLVDTVFKANDNGDATNKKDAIAVHCVAGLGRAPVLVAIALVESGMDPFDAIAFIRKKRRGAINVKQLHYIENYKPRNKEKGCCHIL